MGNACDKLSGRPGQRYADYDMPYGASTGGSQFNQRLGGNNYSQPYSQPTYPPPQPVTVPLPQVQPQVQPVQQQTSCSQQQSQCPNAPSAPPPCQNSQATAGMQQQSSQATAGMCTQQMYAQPPPVPVNQPQVQPVVNPMNPSGPRVSATVPNVNPVYSAQPRVQPVPVIQPVITPVPPVMPVITPSIGIGGPSIMGPTIGTSFGMGGGMIGPTGTTVLKYHVTFSNI